MIRQLAKKAKKMGDKICPPQHLEDDYDEEDLALIEGFQNFFVMAWTAAQMLIFLYFLVLFLSSGDSNEFMIRQNCCTNGTLLFTDADVPLSTCSQQACELYDFTWDGGWGMFDDLPRKPKDGRKSKLFEYDGGKWCCNLAVDSLKCCDYLPWNNSCGFNMWGSCFAAMCGMLMTQILLIGFYSVFARRSEYYPGLAIGGGVFLRLVVFFITFYLFFGFLFMFLFFWLSLMWCDNPYAYRWYMFGANYIYYFFDNMVWVLTKGVTEWDGSWDMDTMVGVHIIVSTCTDLGFWALSILLKRTVKNKENKRLFDFAFFEL